MDHVSSALRDALAFLTRLPVGATGAEEPARRRRALAAFPVVGALVGLVLGGVRLLCELGLPAGPSTALAIAAAIVVTGALHEDGLADVADGLGVHGSRKRRLEVMRDPRVGTYGALALGLWLLLAWSLLAGLSGTDALRAAVAGGVLGRWAVVVHVRTLRPARPDGLAAGLDAGVPQLLFASAFTFGVVLGIAGLGAGLVTAGVAGVLTVAAAVIAARSFGGATGDTYGATAKLVEVGAYASLVACWSPG